MKTLDCPTCGREIFAPNINTVTDQAFCDSCGSMHSATALSWAGPSRRAWIAAPEPEGCSTVETPSGPIVTASTGSWREAIYPLIFLVVFLAVLVRIAMTINDPIGLIMLAPFFLVSLVMLGGTIAGCWGRYELTVDRGTLRLTLIVGPLRWTRSRPLRTLTGAEVKFSAGGKGSAASSYIEIAGPRPLRFGIEGAAARHWMVGTIRHRFLTPRPPLPQESASKLRCPRCLAPLAVADIQVRDAETACAACGVVMKGAAVCTPDELPPAEERPPPGCSVSQRAEGAVLSASATSPLRFATAAILILPANAAALALPLSGIGNLVRTMMTSPPAWLPVWYNSNTKVPTSFGGALIVLLITTILSLVAFLVANALLLPWLAGRVRVRVDRGDLVCFSGIGPFGTTTRHSIASIAAVKLTPPEITIVHNTDAPSTRIGGMLPTRRRRWLTAALRELLFRRR